MRSPKMTRGIAVGLTIAGVSAFATASAIGQTVLFVDDDASPGGDGTSWASAYVHLQDALAAAAGSGGTVAEVWVAAGTYKPDQGNSQTPGNRGATFRLRDGLAIRGGFAGNEDPATFDLDDRDFGANETILSGDLAGDDVEDLVTGMGCYTISNVPSPAGCDAFDLDGDGDVDRDDLGIRNNSRHVVTGSGTNGTALLDGVTITSGSGDYTHGAGMYNTNGDPTVRNCIFRTNYDGGDGGGVYNVASSPTFIDCLFLANRSGFNVGGAMANREGSHPRLINCRFVANWANAGGAIDNHQSSLTAVNCSFIGNHCTWSWGGALWNVDCEAIAMTNCLFSGNTSNSGGALDNVDSNVALTNCVLVNNRIGNVNSAGGIRQFNGTLSVVNSILGGIETLGGRTSPRKFT